jgi:predicted AlkP superfamily pyrophosphatase or phosphodiesterase
MRLGALLAAALLAAGCAVHTPPQPPRPKLVLLLIVDGLPQRQVEQYRDQLAPDGLARFLDRGAWFADAHYGHAFTVTAAGHATIVTGAHPERHGIIGNDWRDRETGEVQYCTGDPAHSYLGHKTGRLDGTSPKNLRVESVGDALRRASPASKVIGIAVKDRGAILAAGRTGTAYMYMSQTGQYVSTTYYMQDHPRWVKDFNGRKPADAFFHQEWKPMLGDPAYARSLPDEQKWFAKGGKLPKKLGEGMDKPGPLYYGALTPSPFGDRLLLDFARAAIAGEGLGQDDATDILSVSLSSHDYINHAYSAESRLSHDHVLQVDRQLQAFFTDLDRIVGKENYFAVLTADHGFMPAPEVSIAQGRNAGRQSGSQTVAKLNAALAEKFGPGAWVKSISAMGLLFDRELLSRSAVDAQALAEEARRLVLTEPGFVAAYTREELERGSRAGEPHFDAMRRTWIRELSADVQMALRPYWMMTSSSSSTTHGSPHPYDTHVPIMFYGPAWVRAGRYDARAGVVDIAPTIAAVLGIPAPAASEGRVLPVMR